MMFRSCGDPGDPRCSYCSSRSISAMIWLSLGNRRVIGHLQGSKAILAIYGAEHDVQVIGDPERAGKRDGGKRASTACAQGRAGTSHFPAFALSLSSFPYTNAAMLLLCSLGVKLPVRELLSDCHLLQSQTRVLLGV